MDTLTRYSRRGFSLIEVMLAMAIAVTAISGAIAVTGLSSGGIAQVVSGNQSMIVSGEVQAEAVKKAQQLIEEAQALNREDFALVNPRTIADGMYTKTVTVDVQPDLVTKLVTVIVSWIGERGQVLSTKLSTALTNVHGGASSCSSVLTGDWEHPQFINTTQIAMNPNLLTSIAVADDRVYLVGEHTGLKSDLYIADVTDPTTPTQKGDVDSIDNGLNAVTVAGGYAFVAANNDDSKGQWQVINVHDPDAPGPATTYTLSGNKGKGKSIFLYNDTLYLGLTNSGGTGAEFHVYDVSAPTSPIWRASYSVGADVNAIYVKGKYAYIVTSDTEKLTMLDISTANYPSIPRVGGSGSSLESGALGKSVQVIGNTAYVGLDESASKQLYLFDVTTPLTPLPVIGTPVATGSTVNGIVIRDYLAFLTTDTEFQVWNISDTSNILKKGFLSIDGTAPAIDCAKNVVYVGQTGPSGGSGSDVLKVIGPGAIYSLAHSGGIALTQGESGNTTITKTLLSGTAANTALSATGLPSGAVASFSNDPCTPSCSSTMTISTTYPTTPPGTYPIIVTSGGVTTSFNLVVDAVPPFDYTVSASPATLSFTRTAPGTETITVTTTAGTAQAVTVTLSGLPSQVSATPASGTCTPTSGSCTLTFTLSTNASAHKTGTVTVTAAPSSKTTTFDIVAN